MLSLKTLELPFFALLNMDLIGSMRMPSTETLSLSLFHYVLFLTSMEDTDRLS